MATQVYSSEKLCSMLSETHLHAVIRHAWKANPSNLRSIYRLRMQVFRGRVKKNSGLQLLHILEHLTEDARELHDAACVLLNTWFDGQPQLQSQVSQFLLIAGCSPAQPDFNNDEITYNRLPERLVESGSQAVYLHFDDGEQSENHKRNATLMSALLGWCPLEIDASDLSASQNVDELLQANELNVDDGVPQSNIEPRVRVAVDTLQEAGTRGSEQGVSVPEESARAMENVAISNDQEALLVELEGYEAERNSLASVLEDVVQKMRSDKYGSGLTDVLASIPDLKRKAEILRGRLMRERRAFDGGSKIIAASSPRGAHDPTEAASSLIDLWWALQVDMLSGRLQSVKSELSGLFGEKKTELAEAVSSIEARLLKLDRHEILPAHSEVMAISAQVQEARRLCLLSTLGKEIVGNGSDEVLGMLIEQLAGKSMPEDLLLLLPAASILKLRVPENQSTEFIGSLVGCAKRWRLKFVHAFLTGVQYHEVVAFSAIGREFIVCSALIGYLSGKKDEAVLSCYQSSLGNVVDSYPHLNKLLKCMVDGTDFEFTAFEKDDLERKRRELRSVWARKDNRYVSIDATLDPRFARLVALYIYDPLLRLFETLDGEDSAKIRETLAPFEDVEDLSARLLADAIREESKGRQHPLRNVAIEKKVTRSLVEVCSHLKAFGELKLAEMDAGKGTSIERVGLADDLEHWAHDRPVLSDLIEMLKERLSSSSQVSPLLVERSIEELIVEEILDSKIWSIHCPVAGIALTNSAPQLTDLIGEMLRTLRDDPGISDSIDLLLSRSATRPAKALLSLAMEHSSAYNQVLERCKEEVSSLRLDAESKGVGVGTEFIHAVEEERWGVARTIAEAGIHKYENEMQSVRKSVSRRFSSLYDNMADWKRKYLQEESRIESRAFELAKQIFRHIDSIVDRKDIPKLDLAEESIRELEHFFYHRRESLDQLDRLNVDLGAAEESPTQIGNGYLQQPLEQILEHVEKGDYANLGLSQIPWQELSLDRKEDIEELLREWIFLRDKPSLRYEVLGSAAPLNEEIGQSFINLCNRLSKMCHLYRTNETKRIGQDPFEEWATAEIPFTFCTRLRKPRCTALDQPIRIYMFTEPQLKSKRYVRHVEDHINERGYSHNSFSIFAILGDRAEFDSKIMSNSMRSLPVLDETALKKILFGSDRDRPPKWEFVSLLTLNNKISSLQPFKIQGSISSESGIFVGREDLIKEMTTVSKDYAIYGGRRIGKSSLIAEIQKQMEEKGCVTVYQSLQGQSETRSIGKAILLYLRKRGLFVGRLEDIESLDDFYIALQQVYYEHPETAIVFFLDEVDELIIREREAGRHQLIEIFRDMAHHTSHRWRFIFAGFKEMYLQIHGKGLYESRRNPWENFVDDSNKGLSGLETPRELIDEGLRNILGLEYDKEVSALIENYSSAHPAFLQKFCQRLVESIDERISPTNRRIYIEDVERVFSQEKSLHTICGGNTQPKPIWPSKGDGTDCCN